MNINEEMDTTGEVYLTECSRDAIQGIDVFIPTEKKVHYLQQVLDSQLFDVLDFGSFVSEKAVPQMADTHMTASALEKKGKTKLLAIVAHEDGAAEATKCKNLDYIGYPFSLSEQFQLRNTRSTVAASFLRVGKLQEMAERAGKTLVVYLSMAFGNPYGDPWSIDLLLEWTERIHSLGVTRFSIADTTGEGNENRVKKVLQSMYDAYPAMDFSVHFHSRPQDAERKISIAYDAGCRHFEGAMLGFGGCPFAQDHLVGNVDSETLLQRFRNTKPDEIRQMQESFRQLIRI